MVIVQLPAIEPNDRQPDSAASLEKGWPDKPYVEATVHIQPLGSSGDEAGRICWSPAFACAIFRIRISKSQLLHDGSREYG